MGKALIIAEKPSVASDIARALGGMVFTSYPLLGGARRSRRAGIFSSL